MIRHPASVVFLAMLALMGACRSSAQSESLRSAAAMPTRDSGDGLLYATIRDGWEFDTVLILESLIPPVPELTNAMGTFSREAKPGLHGLPNRDSAMALDDRGLLTIEDKSRLPLGSATSTQSRSHGGTKVEFRLLLVRHEPLKSTAHLAAAPDDYDPRENRNRARTQVSNYSHVWYEQILAPRKTSSIGSSS